MTDVRTMEVTTSGKIPVVRDVIDGLTREVHRWECMVPVLQEDHQHRLTMGGLRDSGGAHAGTVGRPTITRIIALYLWTKHEFGRG